MPFTAIGATYLYSLPRRVNCVFSNDGHVCEGVRSYCKSGFVVEGGPCETIKDCDSAGGRLLDQLSNDYELSAFVV